jgi:hypothetical protein
LVSYLGCGVGYELSVLGYDGKEPIRSGPDGNGSDGNESDDG